MIIRIPRWCGPVLLAGVILLAVPGAADAQKVPVRFDDYHGYTGTVDYLQQVARAYPDITELIEIGRSTFDRPIYVLVISNMKTGTTIDRHVPLRNMRRENVENVPPFKPYHGKPGQWIDGGTHGNEYTGTEVCLYIIDRLLAGYEADPQIRRLIDDNVFYICPIVNPDGVFNSVERDISQRQNSMMIDHDGDGRINEDGPDDLNGDGNITQFRYLDPEGAWVIDPIEPRLMVRIPRGENPAGPRYSVVREDRDNDGDGRRGEDPEAGIDVNRNYPEGWWTDDMRPGGTGDYPTSAPESRAVVEFFFNHTNILLVQSFHTSGGFTYRPFARWPDSRMDPGDLEIYDRVMGVRYLELLGVEVPAAWRETDTSAGGRGGSGQRPATAMPYEWRAPYNAQQDRAYGYGIFIDWAHAQFGAWSMTTELWNRSRDIEGMPVFEGPDARLEQDRWLLAYQDQHYDGRLFVPWTPFRHPDLGQGEIGGWISRYGGGNALPGAPLLGICETHWQFELWKAQLLPRLEITGVNAEVLFSGTGTGGERYRLVEVTATVENHGSLPTHMARGAALPGNRADVVWLIGDRDHMRFLQGSPFIQIGVLAGTLPVPGQPAAPQATGRGGAPATGGPPGGGRGGAAPRQEVAPGSSRQVTWLVELTADMPLKVVLTSQKGGTRVHEIRVR